MVDNSTLIDLLTTVLTLPLGEGKTLHFESRRQLLNLRARFYQLKRDARRKSRRGINPMDPTYDTSPWDILATRIVGHNMLWFGTETLNTLGVVKIT